jgi:hypothetical protein
MPKYSENVRFSGETGSSRPTVQTALLTHSAGIGDELRRHRCVHRPANHTAREEIDDGVHTRPAFARARGQCRFRILDDIVELNGVATG